MFLYAMSFLLMLFLSPVTMFGAEAVALEAACKRTEAARHQDILKASFISLLTDNPVDLEHGIAYGKSLWNRGMNILFPASPAQAKASKLKALRKNRPQVSVIQMIKENIEKFYNVDDPELVQKNQFIGAQCQAHTDALKLLEDIEAASAIVSEGKKANPEYILIQQHYNHLFEQYRFELDALFPSYQKILNPFAESKESYSQALTDFFAELQSKGDQLKALRQKVRAAQEKYHVINTKVIKVALKERAQECKKHLQALQSKSYDSQVQDALKIAIRKCDDPVLTQVDLLKFEMVIEQQALIPLKPSAHFDRHDAKNLGKLFLVIAVVGAVFYNKYKKDQKVYLDKLHAKIIYAEMPKEKREALLKRLECFKIKYVPHWIRKRTKHDAFDKKVNALYQATREKKLKALQLSKSAAITSKASTL